MGNPIPHEALTGAIDGSNRVFNFSVPYTAGSTAIWLNGQLLTHPAGNAWAETDPSTGEITIDVGCEPIPGDVIVGTAIDTTDGNEVEISEITGSIDALGDISGLIEPDMELNGDVDQPFSVGGLIGEQPLSGSLEPAAGLGGILEEC